MALIALAVFAAALTLQGDGRKVGTGLEPTSSACSAGLAALEDALSSRDRHRRFLLTDRVDRDVVETLELFGRPGDAPARWVSLPATLPITYARAPNPELLKRFADRGWDSVASCPNVRVLVARKGIRIGRPKAQRPRWNQEYPVATIELSLPVVSEDDSEALVYESTVYGPLSGGANALLLRKSPDGRWAVVALHGLWVS